MDITPTTLILLGLVCVVLGFLASILVNTLREENALADIGTDDTPPGGRKGKYDFVTRLWRERGAGTLVVEMDGKSYVGPGPLNKAQRERLETTARDLNAFLGMAPSTGADAPAAVQAAPESPVTAVPAPVLPPPLVEPAVEPTPVRTPTPPARPVPRAEVVPTLKPAGKGKPANLTKEEIAAAKAPKSMVAQIEDILQDMLEGTPYAQRGIHLTEDPARGVMVQVGLDHYEGIEAVPDAEIKALIRSAVEKWEIR